MKELFIPSDAQIGNYIITVEVLYSTTVATASQMFSLVPPKAQTAITAQRNTQVLMVLAAALVLVTIGMAIILRGRKENRRYKG